MNQKERNEWASKILSNLEKDLEEDDKLWQPTAKEKREVKKAWEQRLANQKASGKNAESEE